MTDLLVEAARPDVAADGRLAWCFDSSRTRPVESVLTPALAPDARQIAFVALNDLWLMRPGGWRPAGAA